MNLFLIPGVKLSAHRGTWTGRRNMFAGKFLKSEKFLAVLRERIIFNIKYAEVRKMNEDF